MSTFVRADTVHWSGTDLNKHISVNQSQRDTVTWGTAFKISGWHRQGKVSIRYNREKTMEGGSSHRPAEEQEDPNETLSAISVSHRRTDSQQ